MPTIAQCQCRQSQGGSRVFGLGPPAASSPVYNVADHCLIQCWWWRVKQASIFQSTFPRWWKCLCIAWLDLHLSHVDVTLELSEKALSTHLCCGKSCEVLVRSRHTTCKFLPSFSATSADEDRSEEGQGGGLHLLHRLRNNSRQFIKNYSQVAPPLTCLTFTKVPFTWSSEAHTAFKEIFTTAPTVIHLGTIVVVNCATIGITWIKLYCNCQTHLNRPERQKTYRVTVLFVFKLVFNTDSTKFSCRCSTVR